MDKIIMIDSLIASICLIASVILGCFGSKKVVYEKISKILMIIGMLGFVIFLIGLILSKISQ